MKNVHADIACAIDLLTEAEAYADRMRKHGKGHDFTDKYGRSVGGLVKALRTLSDDIHLLEKELASINPAFPLGAGKAAEIVRLRAKIFS